MSIAELALEIAQEVVAATDEVAETAETLEAAERAHEAALQRQRNATERMSAFRAS